MKARMSAATARQNLPAGTQEAVRAMVDAEFAERQKIYANRILLAVCLALNDIAGFGDKRRCTYCKASRTSHPTTPKEPERTTDPRPPRRTKSHR